MSRKKGKYSLSPVPLRSSSLNKTTELNKMLTELDKKNSVELRKEQLKKMKGGKTHKRRRQKRRRTTHKRR
jgi:hypothetical protein